MERETHIIDAENQSMGRLASRIAQLLRGKHKVSFAAHQDAGDFVVVKNMRTIRIRAKKLAQKKYRTHSGYPGGLKEKTAKEIFSKQPGELLRRAVRGMLPLNRLRDRQLKRLKFE